MKKLNDKEVSLEFNMMTLAQIGYEYWQKESPEDISWNETIEYVKNRRSNIRDYIQIEQVDTEYIPGKGTLESMIDDLRNVQITVKLNNDVLSSALKDAFKRIVELEKSKE